MAFPLRCGQEYSGLLDGPAVGPVGLLVPDELAQDDPDEMLSDLFESGPALGLQAVVAYGQRAGRHGRALHMGDDVVYDLFHHRLWRIQPCRYCRFRTVVVEGHLKNGFLYVYCSHHFLPFCATPARSPVMNICLRYFDCALRSAWLLNRYVFDSPPGGGSLTLIWRGPIRCRPRIDPKVGPQVVRRSLQFTRAADGGTSTASHTRSDLLAVLLHVPDYGHGGVVVHPMEEISDAVFPESKKRTSAISSAIVS